MILRHVAWAVLLGLVSLIPAVPLQGATPREIRTAVNRALPLLIRGAEGHMAQRTCFACHNQAVPLAALAAVRSRGIAIPEDHVVKQRSFISTFLGTNRANYRMGKGQGGQADTAGYALLALEHAGAKADETTEAVVEYLLLHHKEHDHWRATSKRPPSEASDFSTTYFALRALRRWATPTQRERVDRRIASVLGWLRKAPARETEDRVFRLWGLYEAGADAHEIREAAEALRAIQENEGGWAQKEGMASDAYATATALTVLHATGMISSEDPVFRRGVAFLLRTQHEDGSWSVRSRSSPFQLYFESGFPHGKDQFISMTASAWATAALAFALPAAAPRPPIPDKLVVLTFDDSSKSHYTIARPALKKRGFGATFFITEGFDFRSNKTDYMTWEQIAELHRDGFEIGNHTRDHQAVSARTLGDLSAQVRAINEACKSHGIPAPVSFAYPGNGIEAAALPILRDLGVRFARRGGAPEYPYKEGRGFACEPGRDHPLLLPSAGDARPTWTLDDLKRAVEQARDGKVAILQFHGVPDTAHSWVNTPRERFEVYLDYLKTNNYQVIALRDLSKYVDANDLPSDPMTIIQARKARVAPGPRVIASGRASGGYAAFPDVCRAQNGDLLCVYYAGYGHVSTPNVDWPSGGRIMAVRSRDGGNHWSEPFVVADTPHDDRDPHVARLRDGSVICTWFATAHPQLPFTHGRPITLFQSRSRDEGRSWTEPREIVIPAPTWYAASAPIRELSDGTWILGLYTEDEKAGKAHGATIRSTDGGATWRDLALIGAESGHYLDAETDVIPLRDGRLLAALRSSKTDLFFSTSSDGGKSWAPVVSSGFQGHAPHFLRHSHGALLLSHRLPGTALHWSFDDGKTWLGPLAIDRVGGAYPSCVELPDGSVYCVYYEEGSGSSIRGQRLRVNPTGVTCEE